MIVKCYLFRMSDNRKRRKVNVQYNPLVHDIFLTRMEMLNVGRNLAFLN